ncbi:hypothetical protein C0Q70_16268 [Pomacea canaliculata]|uniref:Profilin n=1 Tax=Pomacea canaliculata TaxID=400727 RepID=A0A2T7NPB0_POMCA|nr:profilin-like [Pomacea canaliculata]PVD23007.1 hypothetical protein C0Q70_16268 [Pomacea canaliculata]
MCSKWSEYGRILQEKGLVTQFAFYSKGGHLWATTSSHFQVEPEEFTYLTAGFQDDSGLRQRGLRVGGSHYTMTRLSNRGSIMVARDAASGHGCVICCCSRCVIVAAYEDSSQLGACYSAVERLGDFLLDKGF